MNKITAKLICIFNNECKFEIRVILYNSSINYCFKKIDEKILLFLTYFNMISSYHVMYFFSHFTSMIPTPFQITRDH